MLPAHDTSAPPLAQVWPAGNIAWATPDAVSCAAGPEVRAGAKESQAIPTADAHTALAGGSFQIASYSVHSDLRTGSLFRCKVPQTHDNVSSDWTGPMILNV